MADPKPTTTTESQPARSGVQYGLVFLAGIVTALIGHRLFIDRHATRPTETVRSAAPPASPSSAASDTRTSKPLPNKRFDLNKAERHDLLQLPGVGPAMADGILAYRQTNGPFQKVDELRGVRGIGATTLEKLRPWLTLDSADEEPQRLERKSTPLKKTASARKPTPEEPLDLNSATAEELEQLPGIGPTLAQRIMEEREKKPFAKVEDLKRVNGIGPKKLEAVRPFVMVS